MDFLYNLLKVTSMIATGMFGALALLTKYKDDHGKMTKWGKVALVGIVISSSISLGLYILETSKAKAAAEKAKAEAEATKKTLNDIIDKAQINLVKTDNLQSDMEKNLKQQGLNLEGTNKIAEDMKSSIIAQRTLLADNEQIQAGLTYSVTKQLDLLKQTKEISLGVNRSLFQIEPFKVSFTFMIPLSHPIVRNYVKYLEPQINRLLPQFREIYKNKKAEEGVPPIEGIYMDEAESSVTIYPPSPHIPSYETPEGNFLNRRVFIVQFFKPPFDVNTLKYGRYGKPDLEMWVSAYADITNHRNEMYFDLDMSNAKLVGQLYQRAISVEAGNVKQTERIPSLLDFGGTLLVIRFVGGLDERVKPRTLILHQPAKGTCLRIDGKSFQRIDLKLSPGAVLISNSSRLDTIFYQVLPDNFKVTTECVNQ